MPPSTHDREPHREDDRTEDDRMADVSARELAGADAIDDDAALRLAATQRWLVDELRDECSDIGISVRGFDLDGFVRGVWVFAREARRLGAAPERMLVLLKQCLSDQSIAPADREQYRLYVDRAVTASVQAYFDAPAPPPRQAGGEARLG